MGRAALTTEDREAFRAAIREVATRRFAEHGEDGVTMRGLADELGISPMTAYRYFKDRDEIFAMVRLAAHDAFADAQERAFASESDPVRRLRAMGRAYVEFALAHPDQYRVMFQLERHGTRDTSSKRAWKPMIAAVTAAIDSGALTGDPEELAYACWASVHGLATLHLAGKLRRPLDSLVEPTIDLLIAGARAARPQRKRTR